MTTWILLVKVAIFFLSFLTGFFMLTVITSYHKNKPLGMQTFLGRVIVISMNSLKFVFAIGTWLCIGLEAFVPFGDVASMIAYLMRKITNVFESALDTIINYVFSLLHHNNAASLNIDRSCH